MIAEQSVSRMNGRRNRSTWRKRAPVPLCPPHIPYDLTRDGTRAIAVESRILTVWATELQVAKLLQNLHHRTPITVQTPAKGRKWLRSLESWESHFLINHHRNRRQRYIYITDKSCDSSVHKAMRYRPRVWVRVSTQEIIHIFATTVVLSLAS
jgi:hypothetical protein